MPVERAATVSRAVRAELVREQAHRVHRDERRQRLHGKFRGVITASDVDLVQHREGASAGLLGNVLSEHREGAIEIAEHARGARPKRVSRCTSNVYVALRPKPTSAIAPRLFLLDL
ncbi:MAG: hypothetical protein ABIV93_25925, partial [Byssovorax sp.]